MKLIDDALESFEFCVESFDADFVLAEVGFSFVVIFQSLFQGLVLLSGEVQVGFDSLVLLSE